MRLGSISWAVLAAALTVTVPSVAFADPTPQDISQARDLGGQAQAAFDAGNYGESERLFTAAANLYPAAPTLTLGLARAQAKQGKYVLAKESYNKIIREQSVNPNASQAFKDALASAQSEIDGVSAKIAHVTITVEGGAPNAVVMIDNEGVPAAGLGVPRTVDPGQHTVKATADGYQPAETTFTVSDAGNAMAKLTLTKTAAPLTPIATTTSTTTTEPPPEPTTKRDHTYAVIAFGVGGAGLVLGAITGGIAIGKHSTLNDKCPHETCQSDESSAVSSYHTMATLSTVGFIVAGVGAAAGVVLWFAGPKKEVTTGLTWHPYVGAGAGGVTGTF